MNILLTGASGILGSAIYEVFRKKNVNLVPFDRLAFLEMGVTEQKKLIGKYSHVIHAAANTDVEFCEQNPDICYFDNVELTSRLATISSEMHCAFIFISSTGIYGNPISGSDCAFTEDSGINPTTVHHRSKFLAEQIVSEVCSDALILRAGWLFGGIPDARKNFVARRLEEAVRLQGDCMRANEDQYGNPTYVKDFAAMLAILLENKETGVFNLVSKPIVTRLGYIKRILHYADLTNPVIPVSSKNFGRSAKVSNCECARSIRLEPLGYQPMPSWMDSLQAYVQKDLRSWLDLIDESG